MGDFVTYERKQGVALLTIDNPPSNALVSVVRSALSDAVIRAADDPEVVALVVQAAGRGWPTAVEADPQDGPRLRDLCALIEASDKPVVAALNGSVLGSGLELALACHGRIGARSTTFGAPEVTMGLVPCGGGTQRLPRLVGAATALDLLLSGQLISTVQAQKIGLIDAICRGGLEPAAIEMALMLAGSDQPLLRTAELPTLSQDATQAMADIRARREGLARTRLEAPERILDCVEAALLLPFDAGMAFEQAAADDARASDQTRALVHAHLAESVAARPSHIDASLAHPISKVAIVGASGVGQAVAIACLNADLPVALIEAQDALRAEARRKITEVFDLAVTRGQITAPAAETRLGRLAIGAGLEIARGANIGFEAVAESVDAKRNVLNALQSVLPPNGVVLSKAIYLDFAEISAGLRDASRLVGMRFQSPAHLLRLAELSVLQGSAPDAVATALVFAERLGKQVVSCNGAPGLVAERLTEALRRAAEITVEDGATPAQVDDAMRRFGFPLGPFQAIDNTGLDAVLAQRNAHAPGQRGTAIAQAFIAAGRLGRKAQRGWHSYPEQSSTGVEDPDALALIGDMRAQLDIAPRAFGRGEIQRRCLAALIAEGARMIEARVVPGPAEIDVAALLALGFPRWKGGPMQAADHWGLLKVEAELRSLSEADAALWAPPPILRERIKNGDPLAGLAAF